MTTALTWWGHSAFSLEEGGVRIWVDPFLDENPRAAVKASDVDADYVLVTHGHADHIGDTVAIAQRTGAVTFANFEVCNWLARQGVAEEKMIALNTGGGVKEPFGSISMTMAHHSSSLPDGSYGGSAAGFLLEIAQRRIYFAGDTSLFLDMKLIGMGGLDLAVLPIGDRFTMGPDNSLEAIKMLDARRVVPCHYNTWPMIEQDVAAWAQRVLHETAAEPLVLEPGETIKL